MWVFYSLDAITSFAVLRQWSTSTHLKYCYRQDIVFLTSNSEWPNNALFKEIFVVVKPLKKQENNNEQV